MFTLSKGKQEQIEIKIWKQYIQTFTKIPMKLTVIYINYYVNSFCNYVQKVNFNRLFRVSCKHTR